MQKIICALHNFSSCAAQALSLTFAEAASQLLRETTLS
jgi:hypothetical protein